MKLDLTRRVKAQGFSFNQRTGQRVVSEQEVTFAKIILDATANSEGFKEALKLAPIRGKAKSTGGVEEFTDDEFNTIIFLFQLRPTDEKLAFIEMVVELNPGFDVETLN
jgi:hypothetical protein